jgi:hypothetical protein
MCRVGLERRAGEGLRNANIMRVNSTRSRATGHDDAWAVEVVVFLTGLGLSALGGWRRRAHGDRG